jgi:hypothetical protein
MDMDMTNGGTGTGTGNRHTAAQTPQTQTIGAMLLGNFEKIAA